MATVGFSRVAACSELMGGCDRHGQRHCRKAGWEAGISIRLRGKEMSQRGRGHRQCHGLKKWAEPLAELEDTEEKIPEDSAGLSPRAPVLVSGRHGGAADAGRHVQHREDRESGSIPQRADRELLWVVKEEAGERRSSRDSISQETPPLWRGRAAFPRPAGPRVAPPPLL